jgi:hypothetical protein
VLKMLFSRKGVFLTKASGIAFIGCGNAPLLTLKACSKQPTISLISLIPTVSLIEIET